MDTYKYTELCGECGNETDFDNDDISKDGYIVCEHCGAEQRPCSICPNCCDSNCEANMKELMEELYE
jgi:DNA-directed RNA polymerase subunit RPC12/RpoP